MAAVINHNIPSLTAQRYLGVNNRAVESSMAKLSSGLRVNSAADDAAGLAISEKMRGQIRGLGMATKNAQDSSSLIQVAEGALDQTHAILQRMRELAVQSANDTNTDDDRNEIENELKQLKKEIDRIGNTTEFNTKKVLDGTMHGVKENVKGRMIINNNSQVTLKETDVSSMLSLIQKQGVYDGTISIVRNTSMGSGSDNVGYKVIFGNAIDKDGYLTQVTGYATAGVDIKPGVGSTGGSDPIKAKAASAGAGKIALADGTTRDITVKITSKTIVITGLLSNATTAVTINLASNSTMLTKMEAGEGISFNFARSEKAEGNLDNSMMTQLGANTGQVTFASIGDMRSRALGLQYTSAGTRDQAQAAITEVDNATVRVSATRSLLGAVQNRLSYSVNSLETTAENVTAAESRIRDTDMAAEMSRYTKENVKSQAAQSMVAQANARSNQVLSLLQ